MCLCACNMISPQLIIKHIKCTAQVYHFMAWGCDARRGHSLMTSQNEGGLLFEWPKCKSLTPIELARRGRSCQKNMLLMCLSSCKKGRQLEQRNMGRVYFFNLGPSRESIFWPSSMVYISVINTQTLQLHFFKICVEVVQIEQLCGRSNLLLPTDYIILFVCQINIAWLAKLGK